MVPLETVMPSSLLNKDLVVRLAARVLSTVLMTAGMWTAMAYAQAPGLGTPIAEGDAASITIFADGRGLPPGSGTALQGRDLYATHCVACHGEEGQGGLNDWLAGGQVPLHAVPEKRTVGSYWPYAPSVYDYIRRAMPYHTPGQLGSDEIYALVAYILNRNGLLGPQDELNAKVLSEIVMPNRPRFFSRYPLPD